jgi:hypothetical protein
MSARTEERLETTDGLRIRQRSEDVRFALLLTYITIGWMTIEGAASLLLGWASKSFLLEAFGIDSVIELFSAVVLLWRLRVEASGTAASEHVNLVEDRAARLVGYCSMSWLLTFFLIPVTACLLPSGLPTQTKVSGEFSSALSQRSACRFWPVIN